MQLVIIFFNPGLLFHRPRIFSLRVMIGVFFRLYTFDFKYDQQFSIRLRLRKLPAHEKIWILLVGKEYVFLGVWHGAPSCMNVYSDADDCKLLIYGKKTSLSTIIYWSFIVLLTKWIGPGFSDEIKDQIITKGVSFTFLPHNLFCVRIAKWLEYKAGGWKF